MEECFYVESLTNDRLRNEVGDLNLVAKNDRVCGKGSSVVMAAFTHISPHRVSRFSNGEFGVYYAAKDLETAIRETIHHRETFLKQTNQSACELVMRVYKSGTINRALIDFRNKEDEFYELVHNPKSYSYSQGIGEKLKKEGAFGIAYHSTRHESGECVAILRPPAISLPVMATQHLKYLWNGSKIHAVCEITPHLITVET